MASATPIIHPEHVRKWIEDHDGRPARIVGTGRGENPGELTIDFQHSRSQGTEELAWDTWLRWFERNRLALIVSQNGFNKLVPR
jgi:hypothetical protein